MSWNLTPLAVERFKIGFSLLLVSAILLLVGWILLYFLIIALDFPIISVLSIVLYLVSVYFIKNAFVELNDLATADKLKKLLIGIPLVFIGFLIIYGGLLGFSYSLQQSAYYGSSAASMSEGATSLKLAGVGVVLVLSGIYYFIRGSIALSRAISNLGTKLNNMKVYFGGILLLIGIIMLLLYPLMAALDIYYIGSIDAIFAYAVLASLFLIVGSLFPFIAIMKYNVRTTYPLYATPQQYYQPSVPQSFQPNPQPQISSYTPAQLSIRPIYSGAIRANGTFKLILDSSDKANILSIAVQGTDLVATTINPNVLIPGKNEIRGQFNKIIPLQQNYVYYITLQVYHNGMIKTFQIPAFYIP